MEGITAARRPVKLQFEVATENESAATGDSLCYYGEAGGGGHAVEVTVGRAAVASILGEIGGRQSWVGYSRSRGSQMKAVGRLACG